MERRVNKLLKEMIERKNQLLNENIKVFKSKPTQGKEGFGYWLYMSSDSPIGSDYKKETIDMSRVLGLSKDNAAKFFKDRGFVPPQNTNTKGRKAGINPEDGQFGWGYFITKAMESSPGYVEGKLNNLKELVRDYNTKKSLDDDLATGELTIKQVNQIQNLTSAIEKTLDKEMNPETRAKLDKYLDELSNAIEQDEVFDFLTEKYEKANDFRKANKSAGHDYTISNSMIILAADPNALIAAQRDFWEGRNYRVKAGNEYGIHISYPDTTDTKGTAKKASNKVGVWDKFSKEQGLAPGTSRTDYFKQNPQKGPVALAHYGIEKSAVRTNFGRFQWGAVYTDTMVEPIPGKIAEPMSDLIGTPEDDGNSFNIPQKELDSASHKKKLNILFKALAISAESSQVNTSGLKMGGNINDFNSLLNRFSFDVGKQGLLKTMGIKSNDVNPEVEEMLNGYSEAVSNLVKRHYGLPSEESKYNVARQGVDKEEMEKVWGEVIRIAHGIIGSIDSNMQSEDDETLNEVRNLIRNVLRGE